MVNKFLEVSQTSDLFICLFISLPVTYLKSKEDQYFEYLTQ